MAHSARARLAGGLTQRRRCTRERDLALSKLPSTSNGLWRGARRNQKRHDTDLAAKNQAIAG